MPNPANARARGRVDQLSERMAWRARPSQHHLDPTLLFPVPVAAGVTRVLRFQPEIRGESYLAPGKVRQGVEPAG
jgi:hypothetical protein